MLCCCILMNCLLQIPLLLLNLNERHELSEWEREIDRKSRRGIFVSEQTKWTLGSWRTLLRAAHCIMGMVWPHSIQCSLTSRTQLTIVCVCVCVCCVCNCSLPRHCLNSCPLLFYPRPPSSLSSLWWCRSFPFHLLIDTVNSFLVYVFLFLFS